MDVQGIFANLERVNDFIWQYAFIFLVMGGIWLSFLGRFFQTKILLRPYCNWQEIMASERSDGVNPVGLFFASVGGMVGIGNLIGVIQGLALGGPGTVFWLLVSSILAMPIKYSEIFFGLKFRQYTPGKGWRGGIQLFLNQAFGKFWGFLGAGLLIFYGVEVYQFNIISNMVADSLQFNSLIVSVLLLIAVIYTSIGGVNRLARILSVIMPIFLISYIAIGLIILLSDLGRLALTLKAVIRGAFSSEAILTGFAAGGFVAAARQGAQWAVYSGDICVGYDSVIQSQSSVRDPKVQARIAIFSLLVDSLICIISMLLVINSGIILVGDGSVSPKDAVQAALAIYLPFAPLFMNLLIFVAGFSTITAFFTVALKLAEDIFPRFGRLLLLIYAIFAFIFFSIFDYEQVVLLMQLSSAILFFLNLGGILKMHREVEF